MCVVNKAMKCVVSGSRGFLGSNLVKRLESDGHEVIGWDIVDGNDVCGSLPKIIDVDAVFHLACPVNPANYESVAIKTINASSVGTLNMIYFSLLNHAKFLYVSSSELYGNVYNEPYKESDDVTVNSTGLRSFYDISKLFGEVTTLNYHRYEGVDARIIRPFNIYGPGMRINDTRVIPSFMRRIKEGLPVKVTGEGKATRTYCYVDDFIEGMVRAMWQPNTNGEIFNLGTSELMSVKDLAFLMAAEIEFAPARADEQKDRMPNLDKAKKILGWEPKVNLKGGLEEMWKSYP